MKIVNLAHPAVIAGAVRYPVEGALTVTNEQAISLKDSGRLDGDPEDLPSDDVEDDGDGLDDLKLDELKDLAGKEGADVGTAKTKADFVGAIRAKRLA